MSERTVGIIGGMGPAATVDLMRRVVAKTPARDDVDHLHMLVDNNPKVPSRIKALIEKTGPSPAPVLAAMARGLCKQGAQFLAMPCNTAHHYYNDIAAAVDVPVLNLMALVAGHIAQREQGLQRVGLLASTALSKIALYEPYFSERDIQIVYPETQAQSALMSLINAVKADGAAAPGDAALNLAGEQLLDAGAQCLLIACTELSVIADALRTSVPVYDAADILAGAIVDHARGDRI